MTGTTEQPRLPLRLVDDDWRIDEPTRAAGRQGLADARAALAEAARRAEARLQARRAGRAA